ncbi:hypothetical protein N7509_012376 [Penicillium cosmopolitanum]|uniref:HMG box domain-containing protein n=1 Tax=Penicillium cosmopolitanum TaxID=1131564 RepID=A0A9W9VEP4_9EURO|nr:uncharacterized protein N7509_012376 [Penicillium cosmopolitanum]KAJ5379257.1 hypothetical protein N7509_012376 [Penicillium cosmopolitanum]
MASQWASRLGALRHLQVANGLSRPTRVIELQNQLRQLSLASSPRFTAPRAGPASTISSQQTQSFATTSDSAKPKRATKTKTKTATTKRKSSTSTKKPKKELSEAQKEKKAKRAEIDRRKELVEKALKEPTKLPQSVRGLAIKDAFAEHRGQHEGTVAIFKAAAESIKEKGADAVKEQYQALADKNRATNEAAYDAWVRSHTPLQIREANNARRALARDPTRKTRLFLIKDDRLVKRPISAFLLFSKERSSGTDFKDMASAQVDAAKKWRSLSESEKEPYVKRAAEDRERYHREHLEVYGVEARRSSPKEE